MDGRRDPDCLFCRVVSGDVPAEVVHRDERTVAFRDIAPQAPIHVLVVPTEHLATAADLAEQAPGMLDAVVGTAAQVAHAEGLEHYRLVFNTGAEAGQSVFHAHLHLLGGRPLSWPPG